MARRAADWSLGSCWSLERASMTNAELTAENRLTCEGKSGGWQERAIGDAQKSRWC